MVSRAPGSPAISPAKHSLPGAHFEMGRKSQGLGITLTDSYQSL